MWGLTTGRPRHCLKIGAQTSRLGRGRPHLAGALSLPLCSLADTDRGYQAVPYGSESDRRNCGRKSSSVAGGAKSRYPVRRALYGCLTFRARSCCCCQICRCARLF